MILCDIGNTFFHFWREGEIFHHPISTPLTPFEGEIYYISVNKSGEKRLLDHSRATNIGSWGKLQGSYTGMGVDRVFSCIGGEDGIIVDAGSAITIDVMDHGTFKGGYILAGFGSLHETMKRISPALDVPPLCDGSFYPQETQKALGCGFQEAVVALIEKLSLKEGKRIILTGGDGARLGESLPEAHLDETLIFKGMQTILKTKGILC